MRSRSAFTLIELLLALALSVALLALIGAAIQMVLTRMQTGREGVEQARLAAGIFEIISADLRSVRTYDPQDISKAKEIASEAAEFDVDSIDSAGGEATGGASSQSTSDTEVEETGPVRPTLGVYGTIDELQIDVLRVPADWQALALLTDPSATASQLPPPPAASMSTITYGLLNAGGRETSGLGRIETNRDLHAYATMNGSSRVSEPMVIAPEVAAIEFRYYNGQQLLESWDMDAMEGALPQAIQVIIALKTEREGARESTATGQVPTAQLTYSITVPLRGLENAVNDEQEAIDAEAEAAAGTAQ